MGDSFALFNAGDGGTPTMAIQELTKVNTQRKKKKTPTRLQRMLNAKVGGKKERRGEVGRKEMDKADCRSKQGENTEQKWPVGRRARLFCGVTAATEHGTGMIREA